MPSQDRDLARAASAAQEVLGQRGWSLRDFATEAGIALDTARLFLSAARWPNAANRRKIEAALGLADGDLERTARGAASVTRSGDLPADELETVTITLLIPHDEWSRRTPTQQQLAITKAVAAALQELEDQDRRDGRGPAAS